MTLCVQHCAMQGAEATHEDDILIGHIAESTRGRGEREFPFPAIPGNTSLKFPFPCYFVISLPVPGKRKFWPGIRTGLTLYAVLRMAVQGIKIDKNLEFNLALYMIPGIPGIRSLKFPSPFRSIF